MPAVAAAGQPKPGAGAVERPAAAADPPKPPEDDEAKAKRLMQLAENYLNAGLKSTAIGKLKEIVKKYPKTKVAEAAEEKLMKLEG